MSYRRNVAVAVENPVGELLICERIDVPGAWQFPQGGVHPGESPREGAARELIEEVGLHPADYTLGESFGPYRYGFPGGKPKRGYWGQEQTVFRALTKLARPAISLDHHEPEFTDHRWIRPTDFRLDWVPGFKRELFQAIFRDLYGLTL